MNAVPVSIVLIEDDPGHAKLIEKNVRRAGVGNGRHGFEVALPHNLGGTDTVVVRRAEDGVAIEPWPAGVKGRVLCAPNLFN